MACFHCVVQNLLHCGLFPLCCANFIVLRLVSGVAQISLEISFCSALLGQCSFPIIFILAEGNERKVI